MAILKCVCSSSYQDKRYGQGNRVVNPCKPARTYRCTVCGKLIVKPGGEKKGK